MKISAKDQAQSTFPATVSYKTLKPQQESDLGQGAGFSWENRRMIRSRVRRKGSGKRSRPETPLLKWKVEERDDGDCVGAEVGEKDEKRSDNESVRGVRRVRKGRDGVVVSVRKLAAGLWRLQLPEKLVAGGGRTDLRRREDQLGFQAGISHSRVPVHCHPTTKAFSYEGNDPLQCPGWISGSRNGFSCKFSNAAMEGATKWDPVRLALFDEVSQIYRQMKPLDPQVSVVSVVSGLEAEMEQARMRIQELETECLSSRKKLEHFSRKVSEENALWRSREHEKIRVFIDDVRAELKRERKSRQRVEFVNAKLVNKLADAKVSLHRIMQDYEKEKKDKELIEEVCDSLAKEMGQDKAEVEAVRKEAMKFREEVEEERRMLQMAEVWREERVQMKLVDAKVALEEKYSQMNKLVAGLENFLRSRGVINTEEKEMKEASSLLEAANGVNIKDMKEFSDKHKPQDIFSIVEDVNESEIEPCTTTYSLASYASKIRALSPDINASFKHEIQRYSNAFMVQNSEKEEDESGWETVSQLEDQGSSFSPNESVPSIKSRHKSNFYESGTEWDGNGDGETPVSEISEVCSIQGTQQSRKVYSLARLWKPCHNNGEGYEVVSGESGNGRLSDGRMSNASFISSDRELGKYGNGQLDLMGNWSSPDTVDAQLTLGKKGCIPCTNQKNSLKAKLLEARMESQKVQLRHVLNQKM